jgi:hypothetical protein
MCRFVIVEAFSSRSSGGSRLGAVRMSRVVIVEALTKTTAQCVSQYAPQQGRSNKNCRTLHAPVISRGNILTGHNRRLAGRGIINR